jgi:hypothetical protein
MTDTNMTDASMTDTMTDMGEKAMALVDGQLAPTDVPALVEALSRHPPLVEELQAYLALSRSRMSAVFADKGEEAVPSWLRDAVLQAAPTRSDAMGDAVPTRAGRAFVASWRAFGAGLLRRLQTGYRVPAWSLAAGPALAAVVAFAVGVAAFTPALTPSHTAGRSIVLAEADLGPVLERAESGKDASIATLRPVLSFASKSDGWCRQLEVRNAARQVSHALACRGDAGRWTVVASTPPSSGGGFAPAGAGGRKAIDDVATSMMRASPLSREEEAATIGRRWRIL